jgi:hypothetical protein
MSWMLLTPNLPGLIALAWKPTMPNLVVTGSVEDGLNLMSDFFLSLFLTIVFNMNISITIHDMFFKCCILQQKVPLCSHVCTKLYWGYKTLHFSAPQTGIFHPNQHTQITVGWYEMSKKTESRLRFDYIISYL